MENNWIINEANKADKSNGFLILENPEQKQYLDDILINKYWPFIRTRLKETYYNYNPCFLYRQHKKAL